MAVWEAALAWELVSATTGQKAENTRSATILENINIYQYLYAQ
jgi:hypothetical protein